MTFDTVVDETADTVMFEATVVVGAAVDVALVVESAMMSASDGVGEGGPVAVAMEEEADCWVEGGAGEVVVDSVAVVVVTVGVEEEAEEGATVVVVLASCENSIDRRK